MIIRDGDFTTIIQQQEEDKALKLMEKEKRSITSTPAGKALVLVQRVFSLYHFLQYSIPQNLGVVSKVTKLAMESMFFFTYRLLHLQALFKVAEKFHLGHRVAFKKLVINRDDLHQYIDEPQANV